MGSRVWDDRLSDPAGSRGADSRRPHSLPSRHPVAQPATIGRLLRALRVTTALGAIGLRFALLWIGRRGRISLAQRALWMHRSCRRVARAFGLTLDLQGPIPAQGLITSNHLSYLDILAFASVTPCIFVSKEDVKAWPVFGAFAKFGGTLFINRERRGAVGEMTAQIQEVLEQGLPVVLFPEGTSSDGSSVLPFHASLLEAAVRCRSTFTPAAIGYLAATASERDLCYYGDVEFFPHLLSVLSIASAQMLVRFDDQQPALLDRKEAARILRERTLELRAQMHPRRAQKAPQLGIASELRP